MITFSGASPFSEPSGDGPPVIVILSLDGNKLFAFSTLIQASLRKSDSGTFRPKALADYWRLL